MTPDPDPGRCADCDQSHLPYCSGPEAAGGCARDMAAVRRRHQRSRYVSTTEYEWPRQPGATPKAIVRAEGDARPWIGVELGGAQVPAEKLRGTPRYAFALAGAIARGAPEAQVVLYVDANLPCGRLPEGPNVAVRHYCSTLDEALGGEPRGLDAFVVTSPTMRRPTGRHGVKTMAAVVYDCVPERFPEHYRDLIGRYRATDDWVRTADVALAISEATRRDYVDLLGFGPGRVVAIGAAVDREFWAEPPTPTELDAIPGGRRYVLHVGDTQPRKGGRELLRAWGQLPAGLRFTHRLVYAYGADESHRRVLAAEAKAAGLAPAECLLLGFVEDPALRALYHGCAAFAFPSRWEGFGLPVLEAMTAGAPVVVADNSSLPEVAGAAGVYCQADDPASIARALALVLGDDYYRAQLRRSSLEQAAMFSWEAVAAKALEALLGPRERREPARPEKPRVALGVSQHDP